jgi:hypothetical protein
LSTRLPKLFAQQDANAAQAEQARQAEANRIVAARIEQERRDTARAKQAADDQSKVFAELIAEHDACLKKAMLNLVPYSNEPAETLSTAVIATCSEFDGKRVPLGTALFGVDRTFAEKSTADNSAKTKATLVAEIVTFRAELTKATLAARAEPASRDNAVRPAKAF